MCNSTFSKLCFRPNVNHANLTTPSQLQSILFPNLHNFIVGLWFPPIGITVQELKLPFILIYLNMTLTS